VALGIGTAVVAVPSAASAKHPPPAPPTPNISVSQGRSVAVSIDGVLVRQKGSATAFTPLGSTNSKAVARGVDSSATAYSGDTAVARGADSTALANSDNTLNAATDAAVKRRRVALEGATARAFGIDSSATAIGFDTNAVARGTDSTALASDNAIAQRQTATAGTDQLSLRKRPRGTPEGATARADGTDASATATGIDTNAVARGTDSTAIASDINNVYNAGPTDAAIAATDNAVMKRRHPAALEGASARADGTDASASAYGFNSSALARGTDTIALAGGRTAPRKPVP
jgi:hypothetical protein